MKRHAGPALLLFLAVLTGYLANGRSIGAGDTLPARYLPWSLLRQQNFDLDEFPALYDERALQIFPLLDGIPYYLQYRSGHYLSAYTPGPGVLAVPVYAVPILLGAPPEPGWARSLEKLSAAIITALSVVFLFGALRELVSQGWALSIALIYAFGTSSLSVSSQGLWPHGPSQLCLAVLLHCLVRGLREERYLAYAGFAMTAAVTMRSTDCLLVLPVAAWILYTHPSLILKFVLFALPPIAGLALYNLMLFGAATGGAGNTTAPTWAFFSQIPLDEGLSGMLISPSRGLFVYSPIFLFSLLGCITVWRRGPWAFRALSLGIPLVVLVVSKWYVWSGGHSWGPRLLADTAPILCFFLYPLADPLSRRRFLRGLFIALAIASAGAHALGAFLYDGRWDALADIDRNEARLWAWTESPLAFYGREAMWVVRQFTGPTVGGQPTSTDSPDQLAASYAVGQLPGEVFTGDLIPASLIATNTGRAVWLASAPGERGAVRLGWRWYRGDREEASGRALLLSNLFPGQTARLAARISAPTVPGDYTLVIDMVSELVTWFADRGSKPVRVAVRVAPLEMERLLSEPTSAAGPSPVVMIATDRSTYRRGDRLGLTVTLSYPHRPRKFDAYLVLQGPEGAVFVYDGRRLARATEEPWRAWVKELPLPAQATGRFTLLLSELAVGGYRWHVILTEPGSYHAVVRAAAAFGIES